MSSDEGSTEGELADWLRGFAPAPVDAARREAARRLFLAEHAPAAEADRGSRREGAARTGRVVPVPSSAGAAPGGNPDELDGFGAWLGAHPAPAARAEARRRARLAFLTALAAAPPPRRATRPFRFAVLAAAAAAILAVTYFLPEPIRWRVRLDGNLRLDGEEFALGDEARLGAALEGAGWIETGPARARFALADLFELELSAGARLSFPPLVDLDGTRPLDFELVVGEAYLRTSPGYPGNPIRVHTELADVTLHGTTVGVLVDELGTCVCVAAGSARVASPFLATGTQVVGARNTLRLARAAGAELAPFPTPGPGAEHTADLVRFAEEP